MTVFRQCIPGNRAVAREKRKAEGTEVAASWPMQGEVGAESKTFPGYRTVTVREEARTTRGFLG